MELIKNIGYNQYEIIQNILKLYNEERPIECDITYSIGQFYKENTYRNDDGEAITIQLQQPKYKFDLYPQTEDTIKLEVEGVIPLDDNSVSCIMFDPPFIIHGGSEIKDTSRTVNRFSGYVNREALYRSYYLWIKECYRVLKPDGILILKHQDCISSQCFMTSVEYSWLVAESVGFNTVDSFTLLAKSRIKGKIKQQLHARRYDSVFKVLKKTKSYKSRCLRWCDTETLADIIHGFIKNNIK